MGKITTADLKMGRVRAVAKAETSGKGKQMKQIPPKKPDFIKPKKV